MASALRAVVPDGYDRSVACRNFRRLVCSKSSHDLEVWRTNAPETGSEMGYCWSCARGSGKDKRGDLRPRPRLLANCLSGGLTGAVYDRSGLARKIPFGREDTSEFLWKDDSRVYVGFWDRKAKRSGNRDKFGAVRVRSAKLGNNLGINKEKGVVESKNW